MSITVVSSVVQISEDKVYMEKWKNLLLQSSRVINFNSVTEESVTFLENQLRQRLSRHLQTRIPHSKRKFRDHYVWEFVRFNLSIVVNVLLMNEHVLPNQLLLRRSVIQCLLASTTEHDVQPVCSTEGRRRSIHNR